MSTTYIGVIDSLHTYEVRDQAGNVIGKNQSAYPPCPGPGWTLDEATGEWIEPA